MIRILLAFLVGVVGGVALESYLEGYDEEDREGMIVPNSPSAKPK